MNYFFSSNTLDLLLLMEIWMKPDENCAFSEFLPPGCFFFSSPHLVGCGGDITSIFHNNFKCKFLPASIYSSFEFQLFVGEPPQPVLAVVYHLPKYNKDFIKQFSEILVDSIAIFDRSLICGDFNVCCPSDQLATDFINILTIFYLQSVYGPTHVLGHTLDLISNGLSIRLCEIGNCYLTCFISHHCGILRPLPAISPAVVDYGCHIYTPETAGLFTAAF